jgi:hypothetical protein
MGVSLDHSTGIYNHWQPQNFTLASSSSSSSISSDLYGNCSLIPLQHHYPFFSEKSGNVDSETANFARSAYPSPPSTNSNSKRSVPLPCLYADRYCVQEQYPSSKPFGGILDSPVVMRHDSLGCRTPMSPPPTLPLKTQALPPLDESLPLPSIPELDDCDGSLFVDTSSPPQDDVRGNQPPLPVSPEWAFNGIPSEIPLSPERSFLLHQSRSNSFDYPTSDAGVTRSSTSRPPSPPLGFCDQCPQYSWNFSPSCDTSEPKTSVSPLPISPPASPIPPTLDLDDLESDTFDVGRTIVERPYFSCPNSYWEDIMLSEDAPMPSSPSVRSLSLLESEDDGMQEIIENQDANTLHDIDTQYNLTDYSLSPPPSPGQSLLALPGPDPGDYLSLSTYPPLEAEFSPYSPLHPSRSLLLLDDPNDVPPPRSPSPETFQLDLSQLALEGCADPEVRRLWDLRKASQTAERNARIQEAEALEQGGSGVGARWEARRIKKQEKERGREISAMLRLKLAERGVRVEDEGLLHGAEFGATTASAGHDGNVDGDQNGMQVDRVEREWGRPAKMKKNVIGSMEQLVARMLLRRSDASRSLVNRKKPVPFQSRSPLSRRVVSVDDGAGSMNMEEDDEDWGLELRSWPIQ